MLVFPKATYNLNISISSSSFITLISSCIIEASEAWVTKVTQETSSKAEIQTFLPGDMHQYKSFLVENGDLAYFFFSLNMYFILFKSFFWKISKSLGVYRGSKKEENTLC